MKLKMIKKINIGIAGFGTVGQGFFNQINTNGSGNHIQIIFLCIIG